MNRGGVTKRQLDRGILGKRGAGDIERPCIDQPSALLLAFRVYIQCFSVYYVLFLSLSFFLSFLLSFILSLYLSLFRSYTFFLLFPFSLTMSTVRYLTLFSPQETCDDPCTRFARYRERIKDLFFCRCTGLH